LAALCPLRKGFATDEERKSLPSMIPKQLKKERDQISIKLERDVLERWRNTADTWTPVATM
jgi:uncharacterized protein (DUF4415 family)